MILEHRVFLNSSKLAKKEWQTLPIATFTISINNLITTGKKLRSIVHKLNRVFSCCDFMLCDTLNRFNIMMSNPGMTEIEAKEIAYQEGAAWLKDNQLILQDLTIEHKLIRWDTWLTHPQFKSKLKQIKSEFENNIMFQEAFYSTAHVFLNRRNLNDKKHRSLCIEYLQEECAVMLLWAESGYNFELYTATRNQAMDITFQVFIKEQFLNRIMLPVKVDVKYKLKKEQEIAASALQNILKLTNSNIYVKDEEGYYLFCNETQAKFLNLSPEDIIGKTDYDLSTAEVANRYREADLLVMRSATPHIVEEHANYHGKHSTFLSTKSPLCGRDESVIGIVGISMDITESKERARLELENSSYKVRDKLQQEYQTFINQIVHDICSPLATLSIIAEYKAMPRADRDSLKLACNRISNLTDKLLKFAKPCNNTMPGYKDFLQLEHPENLELSRAIAEIIQEKQYEYIDREVQFDTDFTTAVNATVYIDKQAFQRMLSNVINNAVDALMEKGGKVKITLNIINKKLQLSITDNGKGMPAVVRDKIINHIPVTAGKQEGHGIGYGQIWDTLKNYRGSLEIKSELNRGTTVILDFPLTMVE